MITSGIIQFLLSLPSEIMSSLFGNIPDPVFIYDFAVTLDPYFAVIRYLIPFARLQPLFMAIFTVIGIRIAVSIFKFIFGKVVPTW